MSCSRRGQDSLPLLPPLRLSALAWGGPQQASTGDQCLLKSMTFDIVCYFGNVNSWNTDTQSCQHPDIQNHNWVFCRSSYSQASPFAAQTLSGSRCCQEEPPTLLPQRGEPVSFWAFRQVTPKLPCFFPDSDSPCPWCFSSDHLLSRWPYRQELTVAIEKAFIKLKLSWFSQVDW